MIIGNARLVAALRTGCDRTRTGCRGQDQQDRQQARNRQISDARRTTKTVRKVTLYTAVKRPVIAGRQQQPPSDVCPGGPHSRTGPFRADARHPSGASLSVPGTDLTTREEPPIWTSSALMVIKMLTVQVWVFCAPWELVGSGGRYPRTGSVRLVDPQPFGAGNRYATPTALTATVFRTFWLITPRARPGARAVGAWPHTRPGG